MRTSGLRALVASVVVVVVAACGEQSPTRPLESDLLTAQGPASQAVLEAQINGLINALYTPTEQGDVMRQFARIKAQIASGRTDDAESSIVTFVQTVLGDLAAGDLEDPNGAQPPSTADALASLVNAVAQFGGLPAPIPPALGGDQAVAVVGPAGGTVVTETEFGGVQFPAGALPENTIVVVSRLPNPTQPNAGPLPTTSNQYPLFYDFSTTPHVAQFAQPVLVGICQLEVGEPFGPPTQTVANRLQIAHPNPANPSTVELLAREVAPFVDCAGVQLAQERGRRQGEGILARALGTIRDFGTRATSVFRATPAYAVHGGLGGKTTSFSPFGAVDPGSVTPLFGQLALGYEHGCAIANDGETYCWGIDGVNFTTYVGLGALGQGSIVTTNSPRAPVKVVGGHLFTMISSHDPHTCGLLANGTAMCWGRDNGSLGRGIPVGNIAAPAPVQGGPWSTISAGVLATCGIDVSNAAWCWGISQNSVLGNPAFTTTQFSPIPVATSVQFRSVALGWVHACALTTGGASGNAYCWGSGTSLGAIGSPDVPTPTLLSSPVTFTHLSAGANHTCGITPALEAYCWGQNATGQLGDGTTQQRTNPLPVAGNVRFVMIATSPVTDVSGNFTCALATSGQAYCWGGNQSGQLGDGTTVDRLTPTPVSTSQRFVSIAAGRDFACGMTVNRQVYCWGNNSNGDLGTGVAGAPSSTPLRVASPF